jgi:hypothetical protein
MYCRSPVTHFLRTDYNILYNYKKMWALSLDLFQRETHENSGTLILGNKCLQTEALFTSSRNFFTY